MNHLTGPQFPHLQTALIVFISAPVWYEILLVTCLHGSEICRPGVPQQARHIFTCGVSQAHFVPTNPAQLLRLAVSRSCRRLRPSPLFTAAPPQKQEEKPHYTCLTDSATPVDFSQLISAAALRSHLVWPSLDPHPAPLRSGSPGLWFPEHTCAEEAAQHLCKWVRDGFEGEHFVRNNAR